VNGSISRRCVHKADGFAIETDEHNNITLFRGSKLLAQFSRALNKETMVQVFVKLVKDYELRDEQLASKRYTQ